MPDILERFVTRRGRSALIEGGDGNGNGDNAAPAETEEGGAGAPAPAPEGGDDDAGAGDDGETEATPSPEGGEPVPDDGGDTAAANAADVSRMCEAAGYGRLASGLIGDHASVAVVESTLANAAEITNAVRLARIVRPEIDPQLAATYIDVDASATHAKSMLFDKLVASQSPEIANSRPADHVNGSEHPDYWSKTVTEYNDRVGARRR